MYEQFVHMQDLHEIRFVKQYIKELHVMNNMICSKLVQIRFSIFDYVIQRNFYGANSIQHVIVFDKAVLENYFQN